MLEMDISLLLKESINAIITELNYNESHIKDPNIRAIIKASEKLTKEEALELRIFAQRLFPKAFEKSN